MIDTRSLFRLLYPSGTRSVYVSGTGSDSNNGSSSLLAYRTLQKAANNSQPGDRIFVGTGTYDYCQFYGKNGNAGSYITMENVIGTSPIIDVSNSITSFDVTKLNNGLDIQNGSYIAIYGLEIHGLQTSSDTNPSGIGIYGGAHHVGVWNCNIHDFPGGGINCFYVPVNGAIPAGGWDCVDLWFNIIHATSKYSPENTSGISLYGGVDSTNGALLTGGYGYRAIGNYIYDVICTVPFTPGGFNFVTDGNGISIDSLYVPNSANPGLAPYVKRGLVEGNVVVGCGGRGIHPYNSINIDVVFNTLIGNLRTNSSAINNSTEVDCAFDTSTPINGVNISNNVFLPLNTPNTLSTTAQTIGKNVVLGGTQAVTGTNIDLHTTGSAWFKGSPTPTGILTGLSINSFAPVTITSSTKLTGTTGFQTLAIGGRSGINWSTGALELIAIPVVILPG